MSEFVIEIATRSNDAVAALQAQSDASVTTERNITGEVIVALSISMPLAAAMIREISKIIQSYQATIRAQKLKIGKGTVSFEGFSADDVCKMLDKLGASESE